MVGINENILKMLKLFDLKEGEDDQGPQQKAEGLSLSVAERHHAWGNPRH